MPLDLDPLEQRIVGTLIEKEMTVPDTYPLTVNALLAGCNQKSNRDPQLQVEEYEVAGALRSLLQKGWVLEMERDGGRTRRYAHDGAKQLGVEKKDLAILCELLVRGPQAPGELKTRVSRMQPFSGPEEVERRLEALAERPVPYVERLPRRPREHAARWRHLLGVAGAHAEEAATAPASAGAPAPEEGRAPRAAPDDGRGALEERLRALEESVDALTTRLDRLEGR
jgi:uncharacterized protein YceH (UPF0502 family)